jgi:hypothetical protein
MSRPLLLNFLGVLVALRRTLLLEVRHPFQMFGSHQYHDHDLLILNLGLAPKMRKDPPVGGLFDQGKPINSNHIGSIVYSTNDSYGEIPTQW